MDYILLFNELTKIIKVTGDESCEANSLKDSISSIGLDSLDTVMLCIYLGELYGLGEELFKDIPVTTLEEMFNFVVIHKTIEPESIEAAVEAVQ